MEIQVCTHQNHLDVELVQQYDDRYNSEQSVPLVLLNYPDKYIELMNPCYNSESWKSYKGLQDEIKFAKNMTNLVLDPRMPLFTDSICQGENILYKISGDCSIQKEEETLTINNSVKFQFTETIESAILEFEESTSMFGVSSNISFQNTITLYPNSNVIELNNINSPLKLKNIKITFNVTKVIENVKYSFHQDITRDGWIEVVGIVLPTKEWVDNNQTLIQNSYNSVYYIDNGTIFKINPKVSMTPTQITDYGDLLIPYIKNTTISRISEDCICIWNLENCYINLCKQIFNQNYSRCSKKDSDLAYKRDLLWMAINVIRYYSEIHCRETETLYSIQRIIDEITGCNKLCNITTKRNDCGCS